MWNFLLSEFFVIWSMFLFDDGVAAAKKETERNEAGPTKSACIFEYNSTLMAQGEVYSPNYPGAYPNNLNCRYEFYGRENELVVLSVEDFQLESPQSSSLNDINFMDFVETMTRSNLKEVEEADRQQNDELFSNRQCFYDFLDVFTTDGHGRLNWRSRHCGNQIDKQIVSTSPILILVFQTDRMLGYMGFKFRFHFSNLNIFPLATQSICGPSEIQGKGGRIYSPDSFPANTECAWIITAEKHETILVKFEELNLVQPCQNSRVSIWDGYVLDPNKPDFNVCEKLIYYHKGLQQFNSKSNRLVIYFMGNKVYNKDMKPNRNNFNEEETNERLKTDNQLIEARRLNKTMKFKGPIKNGFSLSWTAVHITDDCPGFQCKGGEYCIDSKNFLCQQTYKYCISKELICDGVKNCDTGDESDEKHCELTFLQSRLYLFLSVIGCGVFVLLTLICLIAHRIKIRRQRLREKQESGDDEETSNMNPSYPKAMPTPTFIDFNSYSTESKANYSADEVESDCAGYPDKKLISLYKQASKEVLDEEEEAEKEDKKLNQSFYSGNYEKNSPNDESQIGSRRISTPTYSSSLGSLTSPVDSCENKSDATHSSRENSMNKIDSNAFNENQTENNAEKVKSIYLDTNPTSLRRNSYTKAIFFENG